MNKEEIHKTKLTPLIEKIRKICQEANINVMMHFELGEETSTDLMSTAMFGSGEMSAAMATIQAILKNSKNAIQVDADDLDELPGAIKKVIAKMKAKMDGPSEIKEIPPDSFKGLDFQ